MTLMRSLAVIKKIHDRLFDDRKAENPSTRTKTSTNDSGRHGIGSCPGLLRYGTLLKSALATPKMKHRRALSGRKHFSFLMPLPETDH